MDNRKLAAELRKIEDKEGRLTPANLVETARPARHPLHSRFDWDNNVAGDKWRLVQARDLIRSVRVEVRVEERTVKAVAYVRDPVVDREVQGYRAIARIANDEDEAREAIISAFSRAAAHLKRARELAVALGMAADVDRLLQQVADVDLRFRGAGEATA